MYARDTIPLAGVFSVRLRESPAPRIPYARCRIPRDGHNFIERVLDPDRVLVIEVNDYTQRVPVVEPVLDKGVSGHACQTTLDAGVTCQHFCFRKSEVLHDSE